MDRIDPLGLRGCAACLLVVSAAPLGASRAAGDIPDTVPGSTVALLAPFDALARGWAAAAAGRPSDAGALVLEAADLAGAQGQKGLQAAFLHHAVRLGLAERVAPLLRRLAAELDAPFTGLLADHATAVADGDPVVLDHVVERFRAAGALLLAADAAADAAAAHERSGERRAVGESRAGAAALLLAAGVDAAAGINRTALPTLTTREHEIAVLATRGQSNQDIADRLVLSVRTVEAHLSHVYTKFGISSRAELVTMLAAQRSPARH